MEQVEDTRHALSYFLARPEVDADRVGLIGSSFGAAVALYTAGIDERPAAVISSVAWGNGQTKFRAQHASPEAWAKFTAMLVAGPAHKKRTGKPLMVSRYDIVPIPRRLRGASRNKVRDGISGGNRAEHVSISRRRMSSATSHRARCSCSMPRRTRSAPPSSPSNCSIVLNHPRNCICWRMSITSCSRRATSECENWSKAGWTDSCRSLQTELRSRKPIRENCGPQGLAPSPRVDRRPQQAIGERRAL